MTIVQICILYVKCPLFEFTRDFTYRLHIMHRYTKEGEIMTDYNAQLIDLLNEKILRLEQEKDKQRKEINRQARRIKELEKQLDEALWDH